MSPQMLQYATRRLEHDTPLAAGGGESNIKTIKFPGKKGEISKQTPDIRQRLKQAHRRRLEYDKFDI